MYGACLGLKYIHVLLLETSTASTASFVREACFLKIPYYFDSRLLISEKPHILNIFPKRLIFDISFLKISGLLRSNMLFGKSS